MKLLEIAVATILVSVFLYMLYSALGFDKTAMICFVVIIAGQITTHPERK